MSNQLPPPPPYNPPPPPYNATPPSGLPTAASPVDTYWKDPAMRGRVAGGAYAGLGLMTFFASFLPFISLFGQSAAGVEGDGLFTLFLGLFLIGLGVVRFLGILPGLVQLGCSITAFVSTGLVAVIAISIMINVSDVGASIGAGLILTLLLSLAGMPVAGADAFSGHAEVRSLPTQPAEPTVTLVLGILAVIGVSAFGPAAVAMGALTLQRMGQQTPADAQRPQVLAGLICGAIGTLWLVIFSIAVLVSN